MTTWIIRFTVTWTGIDKALGNSLNQKDLLGIGDNIVPYGRSYQKQIDARHQEWETYFVKSQAGAIDYFRTTVRNMIAYSTIPIFCPEHIREHIRDGEGRGDWYLNVDEIGSTELSYDYVMSNYYKVEYDMFDKEKTLRRRASHKDKKK